MNTPFEPEIKVSREMESWKARREAENPRLPTTILCTPNNPFRPNDIRNHYNYDDLLSKEAVDWFEENSEVFEENFDQERAMFRYLMAGVLCNLRQEGFWKDASRNNAMNWATTSGVNKIPVSSFLYCFNNCFAICSSVIIVNLLNIFLRFFLYGI
mgnify:CR=1 FL=1